MEAVLILEDGTEFLGKAFGAEGTAVGEIVFNTGMTGYQEILTDPSYKGQIVTMTYPHIGNYGINPEDVESGKPQVEGFIIRELSPVASNYRSRESLDEYLQKNGIVGIHQIDTRQLTRITREKGAMPGILSSEGLSSDELRKRLAESPRIDGRDMVQYVTSKKPDEWKVKAPAEWYYEDLVPSEKTFRVAAYDFGIKQNILRMMTSLGMRTTVIPASTPAQAVRDMEIDGLFLSNGPGDPEGVDYAIQAVKELADFKPIFGICLGHQIIGLALGAKTYKLAFGHHGSNHPVKDLETNIIEITAQNHNFAIDEKSMKQAGFVLTHRNLNDGTVEGMKHKQHPVFSVQYHPEASPGPHDSIYLFRRFRQMMGS